MLWARTLLRRGVLDTTLCDKVCQWLAAGRWFSLCTPVSSTNKTDRHDIIEILLKVTVNTKTLTPTIICLFSSCHEWNSNIQLHNYSSFHGFHSCNSESKNILYMIILCDFWESLILSVSQVFLHLHVFLQFKFLPPNPESIPLLVDY
jgi:hypothetical protein